MDSSEDASGRHQEDDPPPSPRLTRHESEEVRHQSRFSARVVYETVRADGTQELNRPIRSLWWSGMAAGIGLSTCIFAQAAFRDSLPDAAWRPVVTSLGYSVGFVMVVIGRMQLFTENTLTALLPVIAERTGRNLALMLRLWSVVLVSNIAGTALASAVVVHLGLPTEPQLAEIYAISREFAHKAPMTLLLQGIPAGFFMAAMVWTLAASKNGHFFIVLLYSYIIALGDVAHVIVGSAECFLLLFGGQLNLSEAVVATGSALVGNVVGGTGLFGLLAYAQVSEEI